MRFLHHQYSKGAHGAIFIYGITNPLSLYQVSDWNSTLREYAREILIILVGNKTDLANNRQVSLEEGVYAMHRYALSTFHETSVKIGENFDSIFSELLGILFEFHHNIPFKKKLKETQDLLDKESD